MVRKTLVFQAATISDFDFYMSQDPESRTEPTLVIPGETDSNSFVNMFSDFPVPPMLSVLKLLNIN